MNLLDITNVTRRIFRYALLLFIFLTPLSGSFASIIPVAKPQNVEIGVFLTSLYDINSNDGTFSADLWFWSKAESRANFSLERVEVNYLNSKVPLNYLPVATYQLDNKIVYQSRKIHGSFLHDYDIKNFPFDRQILQIHYENIEDNTKSVTFIADQQTGYDKAIRIDGWKIISLATKISDKNYGTNFGFTKDDGSVGYSRLTVEVNLKRDAPLIFLKTTLGLFAAVLLALLSCLLRSDNDDLFSSRMGLLGGSLLAVVFNQQFADSKSGQSTTVTLLDSLHMLGITTILVLFVGTIVSRFVTTNNIAEPIVKSFDRFMVIAVLVIFTILSFLWTLNAFFS